jgi:hypothetical protein
MAALSWVQPLATHQIGLTPWFVMDGILHEDLSLDLVFGVVPGASLVWNL